MLNSLFKGFFLPLNSSIYQKFLNHLLNNCYRLEMFRRLWMDLLVLFNLILITGRLGTILLVCMHPLLWVILHYFHPEIYCLLFSHLNTVLISFIMDSLLVWNITMAFAVTTKGSMVSITGFLLSKDETVLFFCLLLLKRIVYLLVHSLAYKTRKGGYCNLKKPHERSR